eukprot:1024950-Pleurochrysis_carterae.AAC.1
MSFMVHLDSYASAQRGVRHPRPRRRHRGLDARARGRRGGVEAAAQDGAAGPQGDYAGEEHSSYSLAQQEMRKAKLAAQRAKRAAKATERARTDALPLAEHDSDLKLMG